MPSHDDEFFQPSLSYEGGVGRVKGSDTSEAHAEYEKKRAPRVQETVFDCIEGSFYRGMTSKEVEEATGLPHQTVSSTIRNLELDDYDSDLAFTPHNYGRIVKLEMKRDNQHAYITRGYAKKMAARYGDDGVDIFLCQPTPRRASYKKKYNDLVKQIQSLSAEMELNEAYANGVYWHSKVSKILRGLDDGQESIQSSTCS